MDDAGYRDLCLRAEADMRRKLAVIEKTYGLDRAASWTYDGEDEVPTFVIRDTAGIPLFRSEAVEVGTFNHKNSTWKWGWCNPSLPPEHQNRMFALRELADITGFEFFRSDQPFAVSSAAAWSLAAISVAHLQAHGCYVAKTRNSQGGPLDAFMVYTKILATEVDRSSEPAMPIDAAPADETGRSPFSPPDRPFGRVAVGIQISAHEREWLDTVLKILDEEPAFEELPDTFRRAVHATPDQPLGVLHSFSKREGRPNVTFWPWQPEPESDQWILDVSSTGVDIAALAALISVAAPSALTSGCGFPYTPVHDQNAPVDPRELTGEPSGGRVRITHAKIEITDPTFPLGAGLGRWTYPTPP